MSRPVEVIAGNNLVEAAIREGKFPESRREFWLKKMAKNPEATAKVIAKLEPGLVPEVRAELHESVEGTGAQAAPSGPTASGPTAYPKDWLGAAAAAQLGRPSRHDTITFENPTVAAEAMPGANVVGGLG